MYARKNERTGEGARARAPFDQLHDQFCGLDRRFDPSFPFLDFLLPFCFSFLVFSFFFLFLSVHQLLFFPLLLSFFSFYLIGRSFSSFAFFLTHSPSLFLFSFIYAFITRRTMIIGRVGGKTRARAPPLNILSEGV